ncbi:MAG: citrate/2-methylcitrate synthase, partial [Acidimicrobiia bacterium]
MSSPVVTAEPTELIAEAAARMNDHEVGSVVVVDGSRPVGILTERDLVRLAASTDDVPTKVVELMTPDPFTLGPDVEVVDAWNTLAERGYRHIPVVDGDELVGLLSLRDLVGIAQIRSMDHPSLVEAPRGLEGVVVAETAVGDVRGQEGFYHYRQFDAVELAEKRSLEDVWYLLFHGGLPDRARRQAFLDEVRPLSAIPAAVRPLLPDIARAGASPGPLDALRTAVSAVAQALDLRPSMDLTADERRADALRICAVTPTLIMALHRLRHGLDPLEPRPDLGYSANYLYLLTGRVPDPDHARAVEQYQISTIDHGFNASTFTARVVTSTGADLGSATVAAIGALSGP